MPFSRWRFPSLARCNGHHAPPELDAIPASVRERATLIFVARYVGRQGEEVPLGQGEIGYKILAGFDVTTPILGAAPKHIGVDASRVPQNELVDLDVVSNYTYLVLLRPSDESWQHLEDDDTVGDDEILAVVRIWPQAERIEIVDYGRFQRDAEEPKKDAPDTTTGYVNVVAADATPAVVEHTDCIEGAIGRTFGFLFRAEGSAGEDEESVARLRVRVLHPPMHNPKTNLTTEREEWDTSANLGIVRFTGWTFEEAWEAVPGPWAIELLQRGKVMARKDFVVTPAEPPATPPSPPPVRRPATEDQPQPPAS